MYDHVEFKTFIYQKIQLEYVGSMFPTSDIIKVRSKKSLGHELIEVKNIELLIYSLIEIHLLQK
jgi:hypothetical protein